MSHQLSGIITSFKLKEDLPNVILIGNFHFIPNIIKYQPGYKETVLSPYDTYTKTTRKIMKELSFSGACAYIETRFFVEGSQRSEVWLNGALEYGPTVSFHGYKPEMYAKLITQEKESTVVEASINTSLRLLGVFCREGMDEFDSARLGCYRSNEEIIEEYERKKMK